MRNAKPVNKVLTIENKFRFAVFVFPALMRQAHHTQSASSLKTIKKASESEAFDIVLINEKAYFS